LVHAATTLSKPEDAHHVDARPAAVKPLLNLSQTCFLSAILQALLHNPLWKQYYLSSGHDRKQCALRRAKKLAHGNNKYQPTESIAEGSGLGAEENGPGGLIGVKLSDLGLGLGECMNCEMDGAFAEVRGVTMTRAHNCQPDHCLSDPQAYGGDSAPFGPITMLFAMWKANTELAGYAQQGIQGYGGPSVWCCQTEMSAF
jgi:ubiquitin carboxyl-terminal hydrolase 22/27/51